MGKLDGGPSLLNQLAYGLGSPPHDLDTSPRRRVVAKNAGGSVIIPPNSSGTLTCTMVLQDLLTVNDGLLIDVLAGLVSSADTSGHLQIVDAAVWLTVNGGGLGILLPLSTPQPTTLFPRTQVSMLFSLPPLLSVRDIIAWGQGVTPADSFEALLALQPYNIIATVGLANNDSVNHAASYMLFVGYRKVSGLTGA